MENLGCPMKSPLDTNLYKLVKLPNGIQALFITVHLTDKDNHPYVGDKKCGDFKINKFNKRLLKYSPNSSCQSTQTYTKKSKNGRQKKKQKCSLDHLGMATVALSVGVGSFSDPVEAPGLAHLCEHMVFLGSKKYPERDAFDNLIGSNGGDSNAVTDGDCTTYSFNIFEEKLEDALEIFVQFFIDPLMKLEDVLVERDIIDSEFHDQHFTAAGRRRLRLLQVLGKKNHPIIKFQTGNKESLSYIDDATLLKLLIDFRQRYYSAEHMTLVIQTGYHFNEIETLIGKYFGQIPNSGIPLPIFSNQPLPFDTNQFRKLYKVIPCDDENLMFVTWELPAVAFKSYRSKPLEYISRVIGSASCGSLFFCLRDRSLITELFVRPGADSREKNECCILFTIEFCLTDEGLDNYELILQITFGFLRFTLTNEPCAWFFEEFQNLSSVEFHMVSSDHSDIDFIISLVKRIRQVDPSDILTSDVLVTEWDFDLIIKYLQMLTPYNANYMIFSKSFKHCNKEEQYFGIKYKVEDIPETLERIHVSDLQFESSCVNPYIPTDFCKIKETVKNPKDQDWPVCVFMRNRVEFWNKYDWDENGIAKASYHITLCSTLHHRNPQCAALLDIWMQVLISNVHPQTQSASDANLYLDIKRSHIGIEIEIGGFIHKLILFIEHIFDRILRICKETKNDIFELNKTIQLSKYYENFNAPETLAFELSDYISMNYTWMSTDLYEALKSVTFENFKKFCQEFEQSIYILGLAEGNVTQDGTKELAMDIMKRFKLNPNYRPGFPDLQIRQLQLGDTIFRIQSLNLDDNRAAIVNIYQIGQPSMKDICIATILEDMMFEPAFQYLRIQENLGYVVEVVCKLNLSTLELFIKVLASSEKFSGSYVKARIDSFVSYYFNEHIYDLTQKKLDAMKDRQGWKNSDYFVTNNRNEILSGDLKFEKSREQGIIASKLRVKDVRNFYEKYLLPQRKNEVLSQIRKMSIQVVGPADKEYSVHTIQYSEEKRLIPSEMCKRVDSTKENQKQDPPSEYPLLSLTPKKQKSGERIIDNFYEYKKTLMLYPRNNRNHTDM